MKSAVPVMLLLCLASVAQANLLVNGDFSDGSNGWSIPNPNATVEGSGGPSGGAYVRWPGRIQDEQMRQSVELLAGETYTLEWDWAILEPAVNSEAWRFATVGIGQTDGFWWGHWSVAVSQNDAPDEFQAMDWTHGSLQFTPSTTASYRIVFANFQTDAVWGLANFSVVPEPATLSVLGLGALALIRRRRA